MADPIPEAMGYDIRRSARARRSRITISEEGRIVVVLPVRAKAAEANDLVGRHRVWIERHRERIADRRRALAQRPSLAFGRPVMVDGVIETLRAANGAQRAALERRLRRLARRVIEARVVERSAEMGITYARVSVRDQRTRWGSASRAGTLSFSWRLILAPPEVLDYVVVHELAHLRVAGHGNLFWALVTQRFGDPTAARRWLRENQDALRHALD